MKTVNTIILFTIFLMISTIGNSQYFGAKAGLNLSTVNFEMPYDEVEEIKYTTGYHYGLMLESKPIRGVSMEVDLLYSTKGFKSTTEYSGYGYDYEQTSSMRLEYLEIPILIKASRISNNTRYFVAVGPYLAFGRRGIATFKSKSDGEEYKEHYYMEMGNDEYDVLKRFDYGYSAAIGFEIKGILLGISYTHGLNNTLNEGSSDEFLKNRSFSLSTGYSINKNQAKEIMKVLNL